MAACHLRWRELADPPSCMAIVWLLSLRVRRRGRAVRPESLLPIALSPASRRRLLERPGGGAIKSWCGTVQLSQPRPLSSRRQGLSPQHWKVPGPLEVDITTAIIDLRLANGERFAAAELSEAALFGAIPWRTFRWYKGQRHCSWCYWAATEDNPVAHRTSGATRSTSHGWNCRRC